MNKRPELELLLDAARRAPNRGRTHLFLGDPLSDGCDKTTVEPGNVYSPGVWTCGVSLGFLVGDQVITPDLLPDDQIRWTFIAQPGAAPESTTAYAIGPLAIRHRLLHRGGEGAEGADFNAVEVEAQHAASACVAILVRDIGPAGAQVTNMAWDAQTSTLTINQSLLLVCEQAPDEILVAPADGEWDSPAAALAFRLAVAPGRPFRLAFRTEHGFDERPFAARIPKQRPQAGVTVARAFAQASEAWQAALPARVIAPDARIPLAWERCAAHILAAMECGLPRIGAVNYPVLWLRDCVIVLRALDFMGRPDLARIGNDYLAPMLFSGGFGAESDAPGEGIWSLVSHARITGDWNWCREHYPLIRQRAEWIERMLTATGIIRTVTENRSPGCRNTPGGSILCLPAQNGLIHGRMDFHSPDFYINCWAVAGLRLASEAARRAGDAARDARWSALAQEVDARIARHLLPGYGNPRDAAVAPYPTGALHNHRAVLAEKIAAWYRANRVTPEQARKPEPLWTYFEAAQAHNAFLAGLREESWVSMQGMLAAGGTWDAGAFIEGTNTGWEVLPYGDGAQRRGWLHPARALGGNMPHNWTSAEVLAWIRDALVDEEGDGLVLGRGVPRAWMQPGARFGVTNMPTERGKVSYLATVQTDGTVQVDYDGPQPYRMDVPTA